MAGKQPADDKGDDDKAKIREARVRFVDRYRGRRGLLKALQSCSYGHLSVISTYNPIYRMYNPIYNQL